MVEIEEESGDENCEEAENTEGHERQGCCGGELFLTILPM